VRTFETGVGNALGHIALVVALGKMLGKLMAESGGASVPPLLLGWLVAALIRVATRSATVAMTTAVGIVAPTFWTWTVSETIISVTALALTMLLATVL
jgi:gluconate:H+ symporter, GntP family